MTRLIDADALKEAMHEHEDYKGYLVCDPEEIIDLAPTVEPKQGEWIWCDGDGKTCTDGWLCTSCGQGYHTKVPYFSEYNFCPNCGADMRVKDELNRVNKELNSEIEYKAKVKELENAIAKCEKAEEEFMKRTCKFRSPTNCDFCSFHSDCDEHWKEGDAE